MTAAIFYDDFLEIVSRAIDTHISRDVDVVQADQDWETENAAQAIREKLRVRGVNILPKPTEPRRDLSQFEGM